MWSAATATPRSALLRLEGVALAIAGLGIAMLAACGDATASGPRGSIEFGSSNSVYREVILEAACDVGDDPFLSEATCEKVATSDLPPAAGVDDDHERGDADPAPGGETEGDVAAQLLAYDGDQRNLYSVSSAVICDGDQLIAALTSDEELAAAWAGAQSIELDEIADFIQSLTPVVLTRDTRLTNHGYRDGAFHPKQSILQAGDPVLVDEFGQPRVRCACGNPLALPAPLAEDATLRGDPWDGFQPDNVVAINPTDVPLDGLDVLDLATGDTRQLPLGGMTSSPRWADIAQAAIPDICGHGPGTLVDGELPGIEPGRGWFKLLPDRPESGGSSVAYDLPADDQLLTAAIVSCYQGGVAWPNPIVFFGTDSTYVTTTWLDGEVIDWKSLDLDGPAREAIAVIYVEGDQLIVEVDTYVPSDPRCCPNGGVHRIALRIVDAEVVVDSVALAVNPPPEGGLTCETARGDIDAMGRLVTEAINAGDPSLLDSCSTPDGRTALANGMWLAPAEFHGCDRSATGEPNFECSVHTSDGWTQVILFDLDAQNLIDFGFGGGGM